MNGPATRTCEVCAKEITQEQIARREAGLLKGVLHCPACVAAKRQAAQQVPVASVAVPAAAKAVPVDEPISLVDDGEAASRPSGSIRSFVTGSLGGVHRQEDRLKRPLTGPKDAATRCRTFHAKLNPASVAYMDDQINEWVDSNPDVYIKTVSTTVGTFEGKHPEPHLIVTLFY